MAGHLWSFRAWIISGSAAITLGFGLRADVAQLVEHLHGKEGVSGSSPDVGLPQKPHNRELLHAPGKLGAFFLAVLGALSLCDGAAGLDQDGPLADFAGMRRSAATGCTNWRNVLPTKAGVDMPPASLYAWA